mgnify:CR=1 FL=1
MQGIVFLSSLGLRFRRPAAFALSGSSHALVASFQRPTAFTMVGLLGAVEACRSNKLLQVTFDPLPTFATAKAGTASNAPEPRR